MTAPFPRVPSCFLWTIRVPLRHLAWWLAFIAKFPRDFILCKMLQDYLTSFKIVKLSSCYCFLDVNKLLLDWIGHSRDIQVTWCAVRTVDQYGCRPWSADFAHYPRTQWSRMQIIIRRYAHSAHGILPHTPLDTRCVVRSHQSWLTKAIVDS